MRPLLLCALVCALCLAAPALGDPLPALRAVPGEYVTPGDPTWPLGLHASPGARVNVSVDQDVRTPDGRPSFRVDIIPAPGPQAPRACAGLASGQRRDLYKTRAVECVIKASRPVLGLLVLTSSNTETPRARDRVYGSFTVGIDWKPLRLPYGTLTGLPGWEAESLRLGLLPGDKVFRPDSVEDFCLGAEAGRLPEGPLTLWIGALRFVR